MAPSCVVWQHDSLNAPSDNPSAVPLSTPHFNVEGVGQPGGSFVEVLNIAFRPEPARYILANPMK